MLTEFEVKKYMNANGGGNPYHDSLGRFCEGPEGAFHGKPLTDDSLYMRTKIMNNPPFDAKVKDGVCIGCSAYSSQATKAILQAEIRSEDIQNTYQQVFGYKSQQAIITENVHDYVKSVSEANSRLETLVVKQKSKTIERMVSKLKEDEMKQDLLGILNTVKYSMEQSNTLNQRKRFIIKDGEVRFLLEN